MLMYRQIRTDNAVFMKKNELPKHVQKLVAKLQKDELVEKEMKDFKKSICKVRIQSSFQEYIINTPPFPLILMPGYTTAFFSQHYPSLLCHESSIG